MRPLRGWRPEAFLCSRLLSDKVEDAGDGVSLNCGWGLGVLIIVSDSIVLISLNRGPVRLDSSSLSSLSLSSLNPSWLSMTRSGLTGLVSPSGSSGPYLSAVSRLLLCSRLCSRWSSLFPLWMWRHAQRERTTMIVPRKIVGINTDRSSLFSTFFSFCTRRSSSETQTPLTSLQEPPH